MDQVQHVIVNDRIGDLRREADSLRTERRMRHHTRDGDGDGGTSEIAVHQEHTPARVRLGHWLIGVGTAVAGSRQ